MVTYMNYLFVLIIFTNSIYKTSELKFIGKKLFTLFENNSYTAFYDIPYAEPPINELRFKPPKYVSFVTNGIYDYSRPSSKTCATINNEDCLYLSIYSPHIVNVTEQYPVLVWTNEYSNHHGPDFFIDENLIVVAVSFRISIFGFLNTEDDYAEGNMGTKDILMALKWLRDNIILFNGDPSRVTIIGSGLASTPVASMLLSQNTDDLFTRAIILDGSALSPADFKRNNLDVAHKLYRRLNGNFDIFSLNKLHKILDNTSSTELLSASTNLYDSTEVRDNQRLINSFGCSIEKSSKTPLINQNPIDLYNGKNINNNVDVIFGYTTLPNLYKLEGIAKNRKLLEYLNYNFQYLLPFDCERTEYESKRYREIQKEILDFYFLNGTIGKRSLKRYAKYVSDQLIYPLLRQATLHERSSHSNVYLFRFAFKGSLNVGWRSSVSNLKWTGATFGDETCYLFRCKSETDVYKSLKCNERHFIKKFVRLLANFVKHGIPTPNPSDNDLDTLQWYPLGRHEKLQAMNFGQGIKMIDVPEEKRKIFWDRLMTDYCFDRDLIF